MQERARDDRSRAAGDQLILVRQTDHAVLSGFFAREWGNDLFQRPEPFESLQLAASASTTTAGEIGSCSRKIDPKTRLPYSFMSLPTEEHMSLYQSGIERVIRSDRYAGLLVSLHAAGLYDRARATIPRFSAKYVKSTETELVNGFLQGLKLQQLRLKVDMRSDATIKDHVQDKLLEANARRLEALGSLVALLCMSSMPHDATIEGVPVDDHGSEVDWELRMDGPNEVSLGPYPFRRAPLRVSILTSQVPKRLYTDSLDLQKTLWQAGAVFGAEFHAAGRECVVRHALCCCVAALVRSSGCPGSPATSGKVSRRAGTPLPAAKSGRADAA